MKKAFAALALLICLLLVLTSCGLLRNTIEENIPGGRQSDDPNDTDEPNDTQGPNTEQPGTSQDPGTKEYRLSSFADLWSDLYDENSSVLSKSQEFLLEAAYPALSFVTAGQYDMLNLFNQEGRFEGKLLLAGWDGFVEKHGPNFTFGYEGIREDDGWAPSDKAGDRLVEQGNCQLEDGHYFVEHYTEQDSVKISRTNTDFQVMSDGSIVCIYQSGNLFDARGDERPSSTVVYVRNGRGQFHIVVAKSEKGTDYDNILISDHGDIMKADAIRIFEQAGYTINYSGSIVGDTFVLD